MTWNEAKHKAQEILTGLRAKYPPDGVRLVLRALSRQHHAEADKSKPKKSDNRPEPGR